MSVARMHAGCLVVAAALALGVGPATTGCRSSETACTPESAGFASQKRLTPRDLPGLDPKPTCGPRVVAIRSQAELRRAYTELGVPLVDANGRSPSPNAIALPVIDWSKESVILREDTYTHPLSWMVVDGTNLTIGSQGCAGTDEDTCRVALFAVPAIVTTAAMHVCPAINCGGAPVAGMSGGE